MTFTHLTDDSRQKAHAWNMPLGVAGFRYADLNRVRRLEALDRAFLGKLRAADAELAGRFEAWRAGAAIEKLPESELIMAVALHLARFVAKLFHIGADHDALNRRVA